MNSPQKSTYKEIYESQNDCSVSGIAIKINCENHLNNNSTTSNNLTTTSSEFNPIPSSSASFDNNIDNFDNSNISSTNLKSSHKPLQLNNQPIDDDIIIELPENVEYPAQEPLVIRGKLFMNFL